MTSKAVRMAGGAFLRRSGLALSVNRSWQHAAPQPESMRGQLMLFAKQSETAAPAAHTQPPSTKPDTLWVAARTHTRHVECLSAAMVGGGRLVG